MSLLCDRQATSKTDSAGLSDLVKKTPPKARPNEKTIDPPPKNEVPTVEYNRPPKMEHNEFGQKFCVCLVSLLVRFLNSGNPLFFRFISDGDFLRHFPPTVEPGTENANDFISPPPPPILEPGTANVDAFLPPLPNVELSAATVIDFSSAPSYGKLG